jgi:hypothetical protein
VGVVLAVLTAGGVLWLWPKKPKDPEGQIRQLVAGCVAGVEKHDLGPLSDALAEDFKGPQGATVQDVKRIVAYQVLRDRETVAVFNPSLDVTVHGDDSGEMSGVFLFARSKELKPETVAAAYKIQAGLERRQGDWKFVSASYEQISWP